MRSAVPAMDFVGFFEGLTASAARVPYHVIAPGEILHEGPFIDLLLREARGVRELERLLLRRRIRDAQASLDALVRTSPTSYEQRTGARIAEIGPPGWALEDELDRLAGQLRELDADLARLEGEAGDERVRNISRRCVLHRSDERAALLNHAGDELFVQLGVASPGLSDDREDALLARANALGLPADHDEARLRDDEK